MNISNLKNMYSNKAFGKIDGTYRWQINEVAFKEAEKPDTNGEINAYVLVSGVLDNGRVFNKTLFSEIDNNAFITACAYALNKTNGEAKAEELISEICNSDITTLGIRIETIAKKDLTGAVKRYTNVYYTDVPTVEITSNEEDDDDAVTVIN